MTYHPSSHHAPSWFPPTGHIALSVVSACLGAVIAFSATAGWAALQSQQEEPEPASAALLVPVGSRSDGPNYPASREGVRGHVDSDSSLVVVSTDTLASRRLSNPASREGARGHVDSDSSLVASSSERLASRQANYPPSREGVRGQVSVD
jgi:hypothetical protein